MERPTVASAKRQAVAKAEHRLPGSNCRTARLKSPPERLEEGSKVHDGCLFLPSGRKTLHFRGTIFV
jgi:hypothetical protein